LLCDDKAVQRSRISTLLEGLPQLRFVEASKPEEVMAILKTQKIDLLWMDLGFPAKDSSTTVRLITPDLLTSFRKARPSLPILVGTALENDDRVYRLLQDAVRFNLCDDWLHLGKQVSSQEVCARVAALLYPFGEVETTGIWVLQLSDLHFGNSSVMGIAEPGEAGGLLDALQLDFEQISEELSAHELQPRVDLVALGGDLADKARPDEYSLVEHFLSALTEELENTFQSGPPALVAVPGNHDKNWDILWRRDHSDKGTPVESSQDFSPDLAYLEAVSWQPFADFLHRSEIAAPDESSLWSPKQFFSGARWFFRDWGLTVFGLNSSLQEVSRVASKPLVQDRALATIKNNSSKEQFRECLLPSLVMVHHPVGSFGLANEKLAGDDTAGVRTSIARKLKCHVFLTGHIHQNACERLDVDGRSLLAIGSGSASGTPGGDGHLLHYNLLRLLPRSADGESPAQVSVFSRHFYEGKFVADPDETQRYQRYEWSSESGWVRNGY
jgi:CheY-like chemotaxis protein